MSLLTVYESALENATKNNIDFNAEYFVSYADAICDCSISKVLANEVIKIHNKLKSGALSLHDEKNIKTLWANTPLTLIRIDFLTHYQGECLK